MKDVVVVGAGQAGLSAAYFLPRFGIENSIVLDHNAGPGGA
ncbi:NAD(P)-binding protein, partial [Mycobacterium kansasii]